jgi:RNA polymerase sigma factor (sigma-70 family)
VVTPPGLGVPSARAVGKAPGRGVGKAASGLTQVSGQGVQRRAEGRSVRKSFSFPPQPAMIGVGSTAHPWPFTTALPPPMETRRTPGSSSAHRPDGIDAASTIELLAQARSGQSGATDAIFRRYLPRITRWARGRLPRYARDMLDTDDLVQDTVFQTLKRLPSFEPQHEGALQAYLRQAVVNRIRDEVRRAGRHPGKEGLEDEGHVDEAASPLDEAIGREAVARFEGALDRLKPEERQAVHLRVELQLPYAQIAEEMRKPTADAARMAVARALVRLAEEMGHEG